MAIRLVLAATLAVLSCAHPDKGNVGNAPEARTLPAAQSTSPLSPMAQEDKDDKFDVVSTVYAATPVVSAAVFAPNTAGLSRIPRSETRTTYTMPLAVELHVGDSLIIAETLTPSVSLASEHTMVTPPSAFEVAINQIALGPLGALAPQELISSTFKNEQEASAAGAPPGMFGTASSFVTTSTAQLVGAPTTNTYDYFAESQNTALTKVVTSIGPGEAVDYYIYKLADGSYSTRISTHTYNPTDAPASPQSSTGVRNTGVRNTGAVAAILLAAVAMGVVLLV